LELGELTRAARCMHVLAHLHLLMRAPEAAHQAAKESLELALKQEGAQRGNLSSRESKICRTPQSIAGKRMEAAALRALAMARLELEESAPPDVPRTALEVGKAAVEILRDLGDEEALAAALLTVANAHLAKGARAKALSAIKESQAIYRQLGDARGAAGSVLVAAARHLEQQLPGQAEGDHYRRQLLDMERWDALRDVLGWEEGVHALRVNQLRDDVMDSNSISAQQASSHHDELEGNAESQQLERAFLRGVDGHSIQNHIRSCRPNKRSSPACDQRRGKGAAWSPSAGAGHRVVKGMGKGPWKGVASREGLVQHSMLASPGRSLGQAQDSVGFGCTEPAGSVQVLTRAEESGAGPPVCQGCFLGAEDGACAPGSKGGQWFCRQCWRAWIDALGRTS